MPTYISTIQFTDQGFKHIQDTCQRAEQFKAAAAGMGIEVDKLYWTLGASDGVLIFQAPDEHTATAAMLKLGASGNVHTQTSRAFEAAEMQQVLGKLSG
jgi:uncharacterized protein with GYD domain